MLDFTDLPVLASLIFARYIWATSSPVTSAISFRTNAIYGVSDRTSLKVTHCMWGLELEHIFGEVRH